MRTFFIVFFAFSTVLGAPAWPQSASPSPAPSSPSSPQTSALPSPSPQPSPTPRGALTALPGRADHLYPGQSLTVVIANASGALSAAADNPVVRWSIDQNARAVRVTAGQTLGTATLTISDATGAFVTIPVRVGEDAARFAAPAVSVRYTGTSYDPLWLQGIVQRSVLRNTVVNDGAPAPQVGPIALPATMAPGGVAAIPVTVQIAGTARYYPVDTQVNVDLQNVQAAPFAPPILLYDDDPERLTADGVLFRGTVGPGSPARLYYYHENTAAPRELKVVLTIAEAQPATVQLIDASAGPNADVMSVGHAVTRNFLLRKPMDEGLVVDLGLDAPYVPDDFTLGELDGSAGTIDIRVLNGGAVNVTVLSLPAQTPDSALSTWLAQPRLPGDGHHRTGVFSIAPPYAQDRLTYTVGGDDATIEYGAQTPPAVSGPGRDYGEYGVLRTIDFSIVNPAPQTATAYLFEEPLGGPVRSTFLVNGASVELGCVRVPERYQIGGALQAPPGTTQVELQTMTDGGSNYPLEVGLTAAAPQPATPPMAAPDGCFPKPAAGIPAPEPTG